jgi:hypothetical protein
MEFSECIIDSTQSMFFSKSVTQVVLWFFFLNPVMWPVILIFLL